MWAAHEGMPLVLRDSAPGLPKQGPPWGIEGEPGGSKNFTLKRPFEANKSNDVGHTGHHRSQPCRIKTPSVQAPSQIPGHLPQAHTRHHDAALKSQVLVLRPIERACGGRRRTTQRVATSTWQHVTPPSHARHVQPHTSYTGHIPSCAPLNKADFSLVHGRCISPQSPDCVRNEGECQTHHVRACTPVFARVHSCFS